MVTATDKELLFGKGTEMMTTMMMKIMNDDDGDDTDS